MNKLNLKNSEQNMNELFTSSGKRKYLTQDETTRFLEIANIQERAELRTFCLVLVYTGCRPSEALALTAENIDLSEKTIIFKTLKQRDNVRFRAVPVPDSVLNALELVHGIRKAQRVQKKPRICSRGSEHKLIN
ncbi:hypothetical protein BPLS_P3423 [Bathymodiolus platifrons methanotrophic gill symbiont]|uniref:tyrosine-type recombinase/integrase n=1 Tax=Bathymodiolus platifrons methanotrophic gill symbiont TaxID=113268 RepID=UPI001B4CA5A3|nr:hypothetical protein BPLS_P3423 [Bathymodiolus platifrons methanotrophic gill symbiont]